MPWLGPIECLFLLWAGGDSPTIVGLGDHRVSPLRLRSSWDNWVRVGGSLSAELPTKSPVLTPGGWLLPDFVPWSAGPLCPQRDCQNYIKILLPLNRTHLLTCGTAAFSPLCTYIVSSASVPSHPHRGGGPQADPS